MSDSHALQSLSFAPDVGEKLAAGVQSGLLPRLHSLLLMRNGKVALERYFAGEDEDRAKPLGVVQHGPDTLHDLRSVTKSIVSLLYGIALEQGKVPPPEAPLLAQFPEYADLAADPRRSRMTVAHALTMTLGTEWHEDLPYTNPGNSEILMDRAADPLRYVLDQPMLHEPGSTWQYNGGATALLGALLVKGTGQSLPDFAREHLFGPLGIDKFQWAKMPTGTDSAASGLRLTAHGLARIGQAVLQQGEGIVPASWLAEALKFRCATGEGPNYGYQWWLGATPLKHGGSNALPWFGAMGNGGQRLIISPATGIVLVMYFGNYDVPDNRMFPYRIWSEIILPGLEKL